MARPIRKGDTVTVTWVHDMPWKEVTVLSTPADTGDLWYVQFAGEIIGINPCSSELCYIRLERFTIEQEQEQAAARDDALAAMDLADLMALGEMNGDDLPFLFEETYGFFDPG